ncbi:MAG: serpin family protein [Parachlamydiaceae bacterium]
MAAKGNIVFDKAFIDLLKDIYDSELIVSNDLLTDVNQWVASKTHHEITEILSDNEADFVLLNAVYLNLKWANQFEKPDSGWPVRSFTCADGTMAPVSMMTQTGDFSIYRGAAFDMLEKPYKAPDGRQLSQVIFLPHRFLSLEAVEAGLTQEVIQHCRKEAYFERDVDLSMPKIKAECTLSLLDILKEMGLPLEWHSLDATKARKGNTDALCITDVLHKTVVSNDEEGTVAAAVTAITLNCLCTSVGRLPSTFNIDRGYAYMIMDGDTMMFRGRISDATPLIVD